MCFAATMAAATPATTHTTTPATTPAAPVASRTKTLKKHLAKLATGGKAYVRRVQDMHARGLLDRGKAFNYVRVVCLFNKAMGKDTSHGIVDVVHQLLPHVPDNPPPPSCAIKSEDDRVDGGTRSWATAHKPAELDEELGCYLISRGGQGAESVFCSEAMRLLFLSTDELALTLQETGLTSVSVWASFMTEKGMAKCTEALAAVFLQRDTEQLEVEEVDCVTRTGLTLTCDVTLSYRLQENGESTLVLSLAVKPDADPSRTLAPPCRSHPGAPLTVADKEAADAAAATSLSSRRTYASERLANLARKRQEEEEEAAKVKEEAKEETEQRRRVVRRRDHSLEAAARPRAKRAAVSSKRRKVTPTVSWSQEGPPLPAAVAERLTTRAPHLTTLAGGAWSRNKSGHIAFQPVVAKAPLPQPLKREWVQEEQEQTDEEKGPAAEAWRPTTGGMDATRLLPFTSSSSASSSATSVDETDDDDKDDDLFAWADAIWQGVSPDLGLEGSLGFAAATGGGVLNDDPSVWLMLDQPDHL